MYSVLLIIHVILAVGIVLAVLLQRSDSDGFGLSGGGGSVMSSQAKANFLTRTTAVLAAAFMVTSLLMAYITTHSAPSSILDKVPAVTAPALTGEPQSGEIPAAPAAVPGTVDPAVNVPAEGGEAPKAAPVVPFAQ